MAHLPAIPSPTSALVKLYVEEDGSSMVRQWVDDADTVATSIIAFVETRAAFADIIGGAFETGQGFRSKLGSLSST